MAPKHRHNCRVICIDAGNYRINVESHREIDSQAGQLLGAVKYDGHIVIAVDNRLVLLSNEGEIIERFAGTEGVPTGMKAIGVTQDGELIISAAHGD
jgi:hypothetical protein